MSKTAISVHNLGKRFRIGLEEERHDTLARAMWSWMKSPVKNLKQLRKLSTFDDDETEDVIWALRDVSFNVNQGEVVGVIGRNGAGKSTLLKILSRITEPTSGYADVYGRVSSLLEVGTGFHPDLTGRENVYLNGTILGMSKSEVDQKFDEIVAFAEVEKFIETPVKRYSSGMRVRLAFAVAAHLEPEILLIDEVLAVGDIAFQKKSLGKMDRVARSGRTVIFVSHNMAMIQALCSRCIVLEAGNVVFDGQVDTGVNEYIKAAEERAETCLLAERTDREGGECFRFLDVEFLDPASLTPYITLLSGQAVLIRLKYRSDPSVTMTNLRIIISFYSSTGAFMFACSNHLVDKHLESELKEEGEMYCLLPKWPLTPGRYFYELYAGNARGGRFDCIKEAGFIDVEMGNYYGGKTRAVMRYPGVFVDFDWMVHYDLRSVEVA